MITNSPTLEEWRPLYEIARRLQELAPWQWMEETNIFGVQNPETEDLGFASVMGRIGEHYAVSIYLGSEGIAGFWNLKNSVPRDSPQSLLEIPQLQLSFENYNELEDGDRETIMQLGFEFRGQQAWPMFRSFRPGFVPWFLQADEALFLKYALDQTMDVAVRFRENRALLKSPEDGHCLIRVPLKDTDPITWEDRLMHITPRQPSAIPAAVDTQSLEAIRRLPRRKIQIETDVFMVMAPIREKGSRPFFPYLFLMVETQGKMIVGYDVVTPEPTLEDMWALIPLNVVRQLTTIGAIPDEIRVSSELLLQLLKPLSDALDIRITHSHTLPSLEPAKASMLRNFMSPS